MSVESTMKQLAKRAAEDKFEQFTKCEEEIKAHLQSVWEEWKPKFEAYDNADGNNAFKFRFGLPEELQETPERVLRAVFLSLDDFRSNPLGIEVFKWSHTDPDKDEQGGEGDCTVGIHFGHIANNLFDQLMDEHQKKRRRAARGEHSLEEELMKPEEEEAMLKAEQDAESGSLTQPLSGFPDDGNPANAEFEELLQKQVIQFNVGVYAPTNQIEQVIEPGPRGRKNDIFENKELFKRVTPRFFFNGEHKQWRRNAPEGWTGHAGAVAAA